MNGIFGWVGPAPDSADKDLLLKFTKELAKVTSYYRGTEYIGMAAYENDSWIRFYKDLESAKTVLERDDKSLDETIKTSNILIGNVGCHVPNDIDYVMPCIKDDKSQWIVSMCGSVMNHDSVASILNKDFDKYPEISSMLAALDSGKDSYESMRFVHSKIKGWFSLAAILVKPVPTLILTRDPSSHLVVGKSPKLGGMYIYSATEWFIREAEKNLGMDRQIVPEIETVGAKTFYKICPSIHSNSRIPTLDRIQKKDVAPKPLTFPNEQEYFIQVPIKRELFVDS